MASRGAVDNVDICRDDLYSPDPAELDPAEIERKVADAIASSSLATGAPQTPPRAASARLRATRPPFFPPAGAPSTPDLDLGLLALGVDDDSSSHSSESSLEWSSPPPPAQRRYSGAGEDEADPVPASKEADPNSGLLSYNRNHSDASASECLPPALSLPPAPSSSRARHHRDSIKSHHHSPEQKHQTQHQHHHQHQPQPQPSTPTPTVSGTHTPVAHPTFASTYSTFASPTTRSEAGLVMPSSEEQRPLLRAGPESMGGEGGEGEAGGPRGGGAEPGWRRWWRRRPSSRSVKAGLLGAIILGLVVAVLMVVFKHQGPNPRGPTRFPHTRPGYDTHPLGNSPIEHPPAYGVGKMEWDPSPTCHGGAEHHLPVRFFPVTFDPAASLEIAQRPTPSHPPGRRAPHVRGDLIVRAVEGDAKPGVVVEATTSNEAVVPELIWSAEAGEQSLRIEVPQSVPRHGAGGAPCVRMRITLWVPQPDGDGDGDGPAAALAQLSLSTVALGVSILNGVDIVVGGGGTVIHTVSGNLHSADRVKIRSRDIRVETISGNIEGRFPLYDSLMLSSNSGRVGVVFDPKPADKHRPLSARLSIRTTSGDIDAGAGGKKEDCPPRDFIVSIESKSGSIAAHGPIGSQAVFSSTSGDVGLRLMLVLERSDDRPATLQTYTVSGNSRIELLEPTWYGSVPAKPVGAGYLEEVEKGFVVIGGALANGNDTTPTLRRLHSDHESTSGLVLIKYPPSWEGQFRARSMTGRVEAWGDGLEVDGRHGWVGSSADGGKGPDRESGSAARMKTISGDIQFEVGKSEADGN